MDFNKFSTKVASNEGRFLHLANPADNRKLYDDDLSEPETDNKVGLWVYGPTSMKYKGLEKRMKDARMERLRVKRGGRVSGLSGAEEEDREMYAALVFKSVGISFGDVVDGTVVVDTDTVIRLFDEFPFMEDQVKDFVDEDSVWMGEQ